VTFSSEAIGDEQVPHRPAWPRGDLAHRRWRGRRERAAVSRGQV